MLMTLTSACRQTLLTPSFSPNLCRVAESNSPLLRVLSTLRGSNQRSNYFCRRFFSSDSSDGSGSKSGTKPLVEGKKFEVKISGGSNSKLSTEFFLKDCLTVLALPLSHRPLFRGGYIPLNVKDPKLLAALEESLKLKKPFAGAFLVKDEPETDLKNNLYELKGKDLTKHLHEVGTLAQIISIQGDEVTIAGHGRIRITEMVEEEPLKVKIDHLKENPYNKDDDDDVIKATSSEVMSTIRDVLKTSRFMIHHHKTYLQPVEEFNYARLADFGAAVSGANKFQCQQVIEEMDVYKRLKLTLELVKKETEITKFQESIAKEIDQQRHFSNEQHKELAKRKQNKHRSTDDDDDLLLFYMYKNNLSPTWSNDSYFEDWSNDSDFEDRIRSYDSDFEAKSNVLYSATPSIPFSTETYEVADNNDYSNSD